MVKAVAGLNWGDEGKGRMVDYFAGSSDMVIRFQGGSNAGHTVVNEKGKFSFHCFPSGVCYDNVINVISAGAVINLDDFKNEFKAVSSQLNNFNLVISDRAILTLPYHIRQEKLEEERLGEKKYGSTLSGIAPTYSDKYIKKGIQAGELFYPEYLKERVNNIVEYKNLLLSGGYGADVLDAEKVYEKLLEAGEIIKPFIKNTGLLIQDTVKDGFSVLLEAQLGALRDVSHGIYPYTTSSSVLAGYAAASVPVAPGQIESVVGVTKAYSTCVGEGAFVTEISGPASERIREVGKEYGAKTGRPRRIGWFDAVATRYGCELQGATEAVVTCLDVLSGLDELKVCTDYKVDNNIIDGFPIYAALLKALPVYNSLPGWREDITGIRKFEDLPKNAGKYIEYLENLIGVKITYISVGPERDAIITV